MIQVNWNSKIIYVPQDYLTPLSGSLYSLNVDDFRKELKLIEESDEGIVFEDTHEHITEVILSGIAYARFVRIINDFTVEFENGSYGVVATGANHNLLDVKVFNQVSLLTQNSSGLINNASPAEIAIELDAVLDPQGKLKRPLVLKKITGYSIEVEENP